MLHRYALRVNPFREEGTWLRCALHAHTTNSDGELAPELLVRHYEWAGYDVLAITDHWARTVEPSTKKLLVIPSTELNAEAPTQEHDAHVLALGLEVDPVLPEGNFAPLEEVVAWIAENARDRHAIKAQRAGSDVGSTVHREHGTSTVIERPVINL